MRNIEKIYLRDILALLKNPLALLIAVGLCVIPALYAWFNIHSNWDPYGNTGGITIALASEDEGFADESGELLNSSEDIIEEMLNKTTINYIRVDSREEAVDGVTSGEYYAAVVFDSDFTQCMYEGFLDGMKRPHATYYENEKRNAVATKITDSAVSSLEDTMNKQYVVLVVSQLFSDSKEGAKEVEEKDVYGKLRDKIFAAGDMIAEMKSLVKSLDAANEKLISALDTATSDLGTMSDNLTRLSSEAAEARDNNLDEIGANLNTLNADTLLKLGDVVDAIHRAENEDVAEQKSLLYTDAARAAGYAKNDVDGMIDALHLINNTTLQNSRSILLTALSNASVRLAAVQSDLETAAAKADDPDRLARTAAETEAQMRLLMEDFSTTTVSGISTLKSAIDETSIQVETVTEHMQGDIELVYDIIGSGQKTIGLFGESMTTLTEKLSAMEQELQEIDGALSLIDSIELTNKVLEFLNGDPEEYGTYFSRPIKIQDMPIYPVENYGSGVAPFYSTLALWVGGVVLVAIIKVHADKKGLSNVKAYQLYFGRLLLFLTLGAVQAILIIWGDLYILGIQCLNPGKLLLAALVASFTFMMLIYSFTLAFGDVGKAIIVVVMVLQIAGSSGTYPIEILPRFYQQVYIFFPFPYAINAMREAIAGTYESDYTLYLLQLLIFAFAALMLGLFIRIPFQKVNHFMEKRMEDTEFM